MVAHPLQSSKSSTNTPATYIRNKNAESGSQVSHCHFPSGYPWDPLHNRGGHVVKPHQQTAPAGLFLSIAEFWLPSSFAGQPCRESDRAQPSICTLNCSTATGCQEGWYSFPSCISLHFLLQPWGCERNSMYMLSDNFSWKTGICRKPPTLHIQTVYPTVSSAVSLESLNAWPQRAHANTFITLVY